MVKMEDWPETAKRTAETMKENYGNPMSIPTV